MSAGRREQGFTLAGAMIAIAVMGASLAAYGELASHAAQREKERELLFVGHQFRQAIGAYYEKSPGAKRYPARLEDLLEDNRFPMKQRYLRRLYADPLTGKPEWGLITAPEGGIMGVHSLSPAAPIKTGGFEERDRTFAGAKRHSDWQFVHRPPA